MESSGSVRGSDGGEMVRGSDVELLGPVVERLGEEKNKTQFDESNFSFFNLSWHFMSQFFNIKKNVSHVSFFYPKLNDKYYFDTRLKGLRPI